MRITQERRTSREGVNAAQAFFERHGCIFQEVAQQNDFGKDGYVDIGERGAVTFLCAALQIKAGSSYRNVDGSYYIPIKDHATNWRRSTVPIFGLVYDPRDRQIRWVDVTGYLREHPAQENGSITVPSDSILDDASLQTEFRAALTRYASGGFGGLMLNLLSQAQLQTDAVYDAWALGRSDPKYLVILRRLLMDLEPEALRRTIFLLSHAGSHPNIFWNTDQVKGNWIPAEVEAQVLPTFRWSPEEIAQMVHAVHYSDWGYGTLGECLDVLFYEDPNLVAKLHIAIRFLLGGAEPEYAVRAASLVLSHAKDKRKELTSLLEAFPVLASDDWFEGISAEVEETGDFSLYI